VSEAEITFHARERMALYEITEQMIVEALQDPDSIVEGYRHRKIYQKKLEQYVLRVVVEEDDHKDVKRVITVYKASGRRYGIQIR
jgi:hypothetical protein